MAAVERLRVLIGHSHGGGQSSSFHVPWSLNDAYRDSARPSLRREHARCDPRPRKLHPDVRPQWSRGALATPSHEPCPAPFYRRRRLDDSGRRPHSAAIGKPPAWSLVSDGRAVLTSPPIRACCVSAEVAPSAPSAFNAVSTKAGPSSKLVRERLPPPTPSPAWNHRDGRHILGRR